MKNRFIVNSNQRPNKSVTTSKIFGSDFFLGMITKELGGSSSNEVFEVNFFQTGYGWQCDRPISYDVFPTRTTV